MNKKEKKLHCPKHGIELISLGKSKTDDGIEHEGFWCKKCGDRSFWVPPIAKTDIEMLINQEFREMFK